jgi:hypothetical protein
VRLLDLVLVAPSPRHALFIGSWRKAQTSEHDPTGSLAESTDAVRQRPEQETRAR